MICEACGGNGFTTPPQARPHPNAYVPCPACGGCGEQSCCEGEQWSEREIEIAQVKK